MCPGGAYGLCRRRSHGEVIDAVLNAPLLVGARNRMLEARRVRGLPVMETPTFSSFMIATPSGTLSAP